MDQSLVEKLELRNRKRGEYLHRIAKDYPSDLTKEEIDAYANQGRSAFSLPLADWAAVKIRMGEITAENAQTGCVQFMPLVSLNKEDQTEEYKSLLF